MSTKHKGVKGIGEVETIFQLLCEEIEVAIS